MIEFTEKQKLLIDMVLRHEGGYVNNPNDKGKETYCGIARAFHPNWNGWSIVDAHKPLKTNQKLDVELLKNYVYEFYYEKFYTPLKVDQIDSLLISGHLFCHGVNAGLTSATKILQKAVNKVFGVNILIDGKMGPVTLSYLNQKDKEEKLVDEIITLRNNYYTTIVKNKPSQQIFLKGWLNRVKGTTAYCTAKPQSLGFISYNGNSNEISLPTGDMSKSAIIKTILDLLLKLVLQFFKK